MSGIQLAKEILVKNQRNGTDGQPEHDGKSPRNLDTLRNSQSVEEQKSIIQREVDHLHQNLRGLTQNASEKMNEIAHTPAAENVKTKLMKLVQAVKNPSKNMLLAALSFALLAPMLFTLLGGSALLATFPALPKMLPKMNNMIPSVFRDGSKVQTTPTHDQQAWLKSLFPFMDSSSVSTTPRILRTQKSYNVIYELPGFTASDLDITTDEDNIYIDGKTSCQELLEGVGMEKDFELIKRNGLCYEKKITAQTTIPRTMENYGDIHAVLKNGILRISIPTEKDTSMKKRVIELFSDFGHRVTHPLESMRPVMQRASRDSSNIVQDTKTQASDYIQYGQEKAHEYLVKPVKDTMRQGSDQIQKGTEKVGEYIQKGKDVAGDVVSDVDQASRDAIQAAEKALKDLKRKAMSQEQHQEHLKQIPVDEY